MLDTELAGHDGDGIRLTGSQAEMIGGRLRGHRGVALVVDATSRARLAGTRLFDNAQGPWHVEPGGVLEAHALGVESDEALLDEVRRHLADGDVDAADTVAALMLRRWAQCRRMEQPAVLARLPLNGVAELAHAYWSGGQRLSQRPLATQPQWGLTAPSRTGTLLADWLREPALGAQLQRLIDQRAVASAENPSAASSARGTKPPPGSSADTSASGRAETPAALQAALEALQQALNAREWDQADKATTEALLVATGGKAIRSAAVANSLPDDLLLRLHVMWAAAGGDRLADRWWVKGDAGITGYVHMLSSETWLSRRLEAARRRNAR